LASSIKTISDAIISRLASSVQELNSSTVATFAGSLKEFVELGCNLPFVGVALRRVRYAELSSDDSLAEEHLTFQLTIIAEDFRSRGYSLENTYGLFDSIRDCLMGRSLGIAGLAPLRVLRAELDEVAEKEGLAVYRMEIQTWQVRQQS